MTEDEFKAVDIVLNRLIHGDPRIWSTGLFRAWLNEEREKFQDERFASLIHDTTDNSYNNVHGFLLTEGYIRRIKAGRNEEELTEKGNKAKELGGHLQYVTRKRKQDRKDQIIEWPKLYWYIIPVFTLLGGWFLKSISNPTTSPIQQKKDTIIQTRQIPAVRYIHDTLYVQYTGFPKSKSRIKNVLVH